MRKLPNKLSSLMSVGLRDLMKAEHDPRFEIFMGDWYHSNSVCTVCEAGAVMAFSLGKGDKAGRLEPSNFDYDTRNKLVAIDWARRGNFTQALVTLRALTGVLSEELEKAKPLNRSMISYNRDPREFKRQIRAAARDLRAVGL